jgi:hypothetical protein
MAERTVVVRPAVAWVEADGLRVILDCRLKATLHTRHQQRGRLRAAAGDCLTKHNPTTTTKHGAELQTVAADNRQ